MIFSYKNIILSSLASFFSFTSYADENILKYLKNYEELRVESAPMPKMSYFPEYGGVTHYRSKYWPNGMVFYRFAEGHYTQDQKNIILTGMQKIENVTKIKFIEQNDISKYYLIIERYNPKNGQDYNCESDVGHQDYPISYDKDFRQTLSLGYDCIYRKVYHGYQLVDEPYYRTILHELIHALGIHHEQSRFDRDDHIIILKENSSLYDIEKNTSYKKDHEQFSSSLTTYDYNSIMHYHPYSGSKNGYPVMIPKKCEQLYRQNSWMFHTHNVADIVVCDEMKQMMQGSEELSRLDICTLQVMYGAPQGVQNPVDCSDVFSRLSGDKKVKQNHVEDKTNDEKLLNKISLKELSNDQPKTCERLFMQGDEVDINNCKINKKSSEWKTHKENNTLSYYRYFSEKNGTCKQEIHTYEYDQVEKKWSENPNIIKNVID